MTDKDEGTQTKTGTRALSSSLRTLAVLDVIAGFDKPVRFADLSRALGGSRASNYQKLITLVESGWVESVADGYYRLTLHAARVGSIAYKQAGLGIRMHPLMQELSDELGESVSLAVLDQDTLYIIEEVLTQDLLRVSYRVGTTMTIENTASGRVFAAFISKVHLDRLEQKQIRLPDRRTREEVARAFYATSRREEKAEILAVGVPIFDAQQRIIAVLSVAGPYDLIDVEASRIALMRKASRFMNETGGWKPWGAAYG